MMPLANQYIFPATRPAAPTHHEGARANGRFPLTVIALFVLMGLSCAKQGYPPGGSDDKTPPKLVQSQPAFLATNVSRTDPVVFEFSESMEVNSIEDNIFIVPIPQTWPEFIWRSRDEVLEIRFAEALLENTTYVISIGSKARDLRSNELKGSIMLSFSTGDRIENGKIGGAVVPYTFYGGESEPVSGIDVAVFRLTGAAESPDPRFDVPDYVTQSGADGTYEMIGLSNGVYRLFAIGDADRNGFYSEGYDRIGVAPFDVVLAESDSVATAPDIAVSARDTSAVQLLSIGVPDSRRIELFFNRRIDPQSVECAFEGIAIESMFIPADNPVMASIVTAPQAAGKKYPLTKLTAADRDGNKALPMDVAPFFIGKDTPDTTALSIVKVVPPLLRPGKETVTLTFNRILDIPGQPESILRSGSSENITIRTTMPNMLEISPNESWTENDRPVVLFDTDALKGSAGNRLSEMDSRVEFRVVAADTLGFIEGTIVDSMAEGAPKYRIELKNVDLGIYMRYSIEGQSLWSTGAVLPGRYLCRAFRDDDGDGLFTRGSVCPYRPAEPVAALPDTIVVVSRWTNGDNTIVFKGHGKKAE